MRALERQLFVKPNDFLNRLLINASAPIFVNVGFLVTLL